MRNTLVPPHGGKLKPLLLNNEELKKEIQQAQKLEKVPLNSKEDSDLIMLAMGAFSPLNGFMICRDYLRTVQEMKLENGLLWPMPVTLSTSREKAKAIKEGQNIALLDGESGEIMGTMEAQEKYSYDRKKEAWEVFQTEEEAHPGVKRVYTQGEMYLGGLVKVFSEGRYPAQFPEFAQPMETRRIFRKRGWSLVTAFQTRNPMHRSHEYLVKIAMEVSDRIFIHPIVGALKEGDIPAEARMRCYQVLLENYFPRDRVVLKVYPLEMRYAGPREALLHAIIRQNFGCSHLIVGRDHAGVCNYYGPFDAQKIFDEIEPDALAIKPLKLDWAFWCYKCSRMASQKTCAHGKEDRLLISGAELRQILSNGQKPPEEFSRPEVLDILIDYYQNVKEAAS